MTRIPHASSEVEVRQAFQRIRANNEILVTGNAGEILIGQGVGVYPVWTTELTALTKVTIDNITIDAAIIVSDTGAISFSDEDLTTTGDVTAANFVTSGLVDGRDLSVDGTKLDGIEALADVTDATNVAAAGAAMAGGAYHDGFSDFVAAEHVSLPNTIANVLSDHDLAAHTGLGLFDASSDVDHDATTNFVANEHIDHSGVSVTAGDGLTGGGTIASTRTIDLDIAKLSTVAIIASGDYVPFEQIAPSVTNKKITFANFEGALNHDSLTGFVANEHIDHTAVSISSGTGLTGGGTIAATRTLSLSHLGIESLSDPGADRILFWDDGATACKWLEVGAGLSLSGTSLTGGFSSRARAYPASAQDIVTSTWTKVTLATEDFDGDGEFASSTFTAASAGRYLISAAIRTNEVLASGSQFIIELRLNGAARSRSYTVQGHSATKQCGNNILDIWDLAATDTIELYVWHDHGANREIWGTGLYTFLAIHRLS